MAVDLEAIRRKLNEMQNGRQQSNIQMWRPQPGTFKVRGLPIPAKYAIEGDPFWCLSFYYIPRAVLSPAVHGKPDPIADFRNELWKSGKEEDKALAKKLRAKSRFYMPIVVRGAENEGVKIWAFGKTLYQKFLASFLNEDIGDYLDPQEGFDIDVTVVKKAGFDFPVTDAEISRRPSRLAKSDEDIKKILDSIPNVMDLYPLKSATEIDRHLQQWLDGGAAEDKPSFGNGTEKGASAGADALDELANDIKRSSNNTSDHVEASSNGASKDASSKRGKSKKEDVADVPAAVKTNIDDAFDDLLNGDD